MTEKEEELKKKTEENQPNQKNEIKGDFFSNGLIKKLQTPIILVVIFSIIGVIVYYCYRKFFI